MATNQHQVNFRKAEFGGRCWADVFEGFGCQQPGVTPAGLCEKHHEQIVARYDDPPPPRRNRGGSLRRRAS